MISKLVAWAENRPLAIARMRRALSEYLVTGIKTTLPFFSWLLEQPAFIEGRFHTTYLDEELKSRNGRAFVEPSAEAEELAAIGAALQAAMSSGSMTSAPAPRPENVVARRWRTQARLDGLR
jgi:acetyl-CoA carboxylase, biotin carboxylase subunit